MLLRIKAHSAYEDYFSSLDMQADLRYYDDIPNYLAVMHPKFTYYCDSMVAIGSPEPSIFLDKHYNLITVNNSQFRTIKEGDIVYIVPAIIGGGGKRGGLFAVLGLLALVFLFPMIAGGAASGAAGGGGLFANIGSRFAGFFSGRFGGILKTLGVNLGLGLLAAAFQPKKKDAEKSRENDAFGGLNNTTSNGTPIPLVYGMPRVAGQLLSGYINTIEHGKNDSVNALGVVYSDVVPVVVAPSPPPINAQNER